MKSRRRIAVIAALWIAALGALIFGASLFSTPHKPEVSGWFVEKDGTRREKGGARHSKVIVFVHGVTGDGESTWLHKNRQGDVYWPELMRKDPAFDDYDIYVVSYRSTFLERADGLVDLAEQLNGRLSSSQLLRRTANGAAPGEPAAPVKEIVFIGHSMGVLVVRTALMIDRAYSDTELEVPLVISIASPSKGSEIAEFANRFSRNAQFSAMKTIAGNHYLQLLNSFWTHNLPWDIEVACARETQGLTGASRPVLVVPKESATAVCTRRGEGQIAEIAGDHSTIAKPDGPDHPIHQWTRAQITAPRTPTFTARPARWDERRINIGGKDFLESNILVALMAQMVNPHYPQRCPAEELSAGRCVDANVSYHIGGRDRVVDELKQGNIDLFAEYTGSLLSNIDSLRQDSMHLADYQSVEAINRLLQERKSWKRYEVLPFFGFRSNFQLIINRKTVEHLKLTTLPGQLTISDLAAVAESAARRQLDFRLRFKSTPDFFYRHDGLRGLRNAYAVGEWKFDFTVVDYTQHDSKYADIALDRVDVADAYTTDPQLYDHNSLNFVVLRDDKEFFPDYHALPMASRHMLATLRPVRTALERLHGRVSDAEMVSLLMEANKEGIRSEQLQNDGADAQKLLRLTRAFLVSKKLLETR